jgi:2-polyprenyl-3-methyl-5-hydroxy-6-metoxy-1,4-benzoquinol methylase
MTTEIRNLNGVSHTFETFMTSHILQKCRFCSSDLQILFADLGMSPLANSYLKPEQLNMMEPFYPLRVFVCERCLLVQAQEFETPEHIFSDYAYFSSYSDSWLEHARSYSQMMVRRMGLNNQSRVLEIASNDGYLLQYFVKQGIPVLGIEPAANVAEVAIAKGVPTRVGFFGTAMAKELVSEGNGADLVIGNNVLAHVPGLNEFVEGLKIVLRPQSVITMEFPHLMRLVAENQFDTIYHEHLSYFSFLVVEQIFACHGLVLFDVDELTTHGGSLRIYARHASDTSKPVSAKVEDVKRREQRAGFGSLETYLSFSERIKETKRKLLEFLISAKQGNASVVGYGAPAKGNTLLNYCGIRSDFIDYTVDRSPHKQGRFLPGTHIPIYHPDKIRETRPAFVLVLPWNLVDEIMEQMSYVRDWGGRFVVPIPEVKVY